MASDNSSSSQEEQQQPAYVIPPLPDSSPATAAVNAANFVPTKLQLRSDIQETNYKTWRQQIECLVKSQRLMAYIDGSIILPLLPGQDYDVWDRNNALVKGWIVGSITDEIASARDALKIYAAYDYLAYLEERFGEPKKATVANEPQKKPVCVSTPLHKAALEGDWETAVRIFTANPGAERDWVDGNKNWKALHIAVGAGGKTIQFVKNLLQRNDDLSSLVGPGSNTALHVAASVGNIEAATLLVERNPKLCYYLNWSFHYPVHVAALYVQREVLEYLIHHTKPDDMAPNPYTGKCGQKLPTYLIQAEFFDIALGLANDHPQILRINCYEDEDNVISDSPLELLTIKLNTLSARNFSCCESLIASWILPLETTLSSHSTPNRTSDIEGSTDTTYHKSSALLLDLQTMLSKRLESLVPKKMVKIKKVQQARQLLKGMCKEFSTQHFDEAARIFRGAIMLAAELDVRVVVEEIIQTFPGAIYSYAKYSKQHIFQKAVEYRSVDVFNLIHEMSDHKNYFISHFQDEDGNNLLHWAAKLSPPHIINQTSGVALQMQRELQWFQEVEKTVHPYSKEKKNNASKTPKVLFMEEHMALKKSGEKWIKETANSFTLVATLIATVVFTSAMTVPGGNGETGFPVFSKDPAFITFAVSVAGSLFASATSLLVFLAILTSRYSEEDFLSSLPKKLIFGLATLFLSVMLMMVSFVATLYLVFGQKRQWVLFPLLLFACMPVVSFVSYQFPLLWALCRSTYGRGKFDERSKRGFY